MIGRIFLSSIIYLATLPIIFAGYPVVALLLLTSWDGRSTIWGNRKWGRAREHPSPDSRTSGYWSELLWLAWRNPVNNLFCEVLAVDWSQEIRRVRGDEDIGDKKRGGFYAASVGDIWEYYWVKPYTVFGARRCVRARIGWKILNADMPAAFVFAINPWKKYLGE